jgi:hypothetical protein
MQLNNVKRLQKKQSQLYLEVSGILEQVENSQYILEGEGKVVREE